MGLEAKRAPKRLQNRHHEKRGSNRVLRADGYVVRVSDRFAILR